MAVPGSELGTVNFVEQDSDALCGIFQSQKKKLWDALGAEYVDSIHHVGSTSIRGMPGPPAVDMIMFVHTWPPQEAVFKALEELKFFSMGDAPHFADDKWFGFITIEGNTMQDFGSGVVHVIYKENKEPVEKQILWAEYCNNNKEAFEAYKAVKLLALKEGDGNFAQYKAKKSALLAEMFPKALEWKKQQEEATGQKSA